MEPKLICTVDKKSYSEYGLRSLRKSQPEQILAHTQIMLAMKRNADKPSINDAYEQGLRRYYKGDEESVDTYDYLSYIFVSGSDVMHFILSNEVIDIEGVSVNFGTMLNLNYYNRHLHEGWYGYMSQIMSVEQRQKGYIPPIAGYEVAKVDVKGILKR